jgi:hypothetical protein
MPLRVPDWGLRLAASVVRDARAARKFVSDVIVKAQLRAGR